MFRFASIVAAGAAAVIAAAAPAFAADSLTLVADIGRDTDALGIHSHTEAALMKAVPVDLPLLEQLEHVIRHAQIAIELNADGKLTAATVLASSGRERLDRSVLDAVRASTYRAERIDGSPVAGRYVVTFDLDPAN
jgi:TonB family protein